MLRKVIRGFGVRNGKKMTKGYVGHSLNQSIDGLADWCRVEPGQFESTKFVR